FFVELLFIVLCKLPLLVVVIEDHRPVLRAHVIALAVERRRVMGVPEYLEQFIVSDHGRIVGDLNNFRVACRAGAYLLIGRVFYRTAGITRLHFQDTLYVEEDGFCTPEASGPEGCQLAALRNGLI